MDSPTRALPRSARTGLFGGVVSSRQKPPKDAEGTAALVAKARELTAAKDKAIITSVAGCL